MDALTDLVRDINKLRTDLAEMGDKTENHHEEAVSKLQSMNKTVEELKEKTWELDTSNRNNLVFYGIKEDDRSGNTELAVKEVTEDKTIITEATKNVADDPFLAEHVA